MNTTYGPVGNWCWVAETKNTPSWGIPVWFWVSYYAWVWMCVLIMIGLLISVSQKQFHSVKSKEAMMSIVKKVYLYPIIVVICWGPPCISDSMSQLFGIYNPAFGTATVIIACMQGFLTTIVYFWKEKEAQKVIMITLGLSQAAIYELHSTMHSLTSRSEAESTLSRPPVLTSLPALLEAGPSDNKVIAFESKEDPYPPYQDLANTVVPFFELPVITGEADTTSC